EKEEIRSRAVGQNDRRAVPRLAGVDSLILVPVDVSADRVSGGREVLHHERTARVRHGDVRAYAIGGNERFDQGSSSGRAGHPVEDVARDARPGNVVARRKESHGAGVADAAVNIGNASLHDYRVGGVGSPTIGWLHTDRIAVPRRTRRSVAWRYEKQVCEGGYRRRPLGNHLVELKEYLLWPDAEGARIGCDGEQLRGGDVRWSPGRQPRRSARQHDQRDGNQAPQSAFTFSASRARRSGHSCPFSLSPSTRSPGSLTV